MTPHIDHTRTYHPHTSTTSTGPAPTGKEARLFWPVLTGSIGVCVGFTVGYWTVIHTASTIVIDILRRQGILPLLLAAALTTQAVQAQFGSGLGTAADDGFPPPITATNQIFWSPLARWVVGAIVTAATSYASYKCYVYFTNQMATIGQGRVQLWNELTNGVAGDLYFVAATTNTAPGATVSFCTSTDLEHWAVLTNWCPATVPGGRWTFNLPPAKQRFFRWK